MKIEQELVDTIIKEYQEGESIHHLYLKYKVDKRTIKKILIENDIPDNYTGRFSQLYEINNNYATIRIRKESGYVYALIDIEDVERCKSVGIWSLTKAGYVINCKTGTYLHRFIMNAPNNIEVDHIYHNLLDNRKSQLRFATSSQQKMNTKRRTDNTSGHRGVYYDNSRDTWNVNIKSQNGTLRKRFKNYEDACNAADIFYAEHFNEFQCKEVQEIAN